MVITAILISLEEILTIIMFFGLLDFPLIQKVYCRKGNSKLDN